MGEHTEREALEAAAELEARLARQLVTSPLPEAPDRGRADNWLIDACELMWSHS